MIPLLLQLSSIMAHVGVTLGSYQKLDFSVSRDTHYSGSEIGMTSQFMKRDDTLEASLAYQKTFYSIDIEFGSQKEKVTVLLDTGSSDLWVSGSENPYCSTKRKKDLGLGPNFDGVAAHKKRGFGDDQAFGMSSPSKSPAGVQRKDSTGMPSMATIDCSQFGTFNHAASTSYSSNNTDFFILYGDSTFAAGEWATDDIIIGGIQVHDFSFAVASQANSSMAVLGIGLEGLETTNIGALASHPHTYSNLPSRFVKDGLIKSKSYSLYLDENSGSVLFGGVDHGKYSGQLKKVPIINTFNNHGFDKPIRLEITLSSISVGSSRIANQLYPALLDSGTSLIFAPSSIVHSVASAFGAKQDVNSGYYIVPCSGSYLDVKFNFQGQTISVPSADLLLRADNNGNCALGILNSGNDGVILGDIFLRSAYVVYDLDNYEIGLAQNANNDEDIEVIQDFIPGAIKADYYTNTYGNSKIFAQDENGSSESSSSSEHHSSSGSSTSGSLSHTSSEYTSYTSSSSIINHTSESSSSISSSISISSSSVLNSGSIPLPLVSGSLASSSSHFSRQSISSRSPGSSSTFTLRSSSYSSKISSSSSSSPTSSSPTSSNVQNSTSIMLPISSSVVPIDSHNATQTTMVLSTDIQPSSTGSTRSSHGDAGTFRISYSLMSCLLLLL